MLGFADRLLFPLTVGTKIRFAIFRDPTLPSDTYGDGALIWECRMHYQVDTVGSSQRFAK